MAADDSTDWAPVPRQKTYQQVIDAVEQKILDGELSPGDRLPGERHLAEALAVSRPSVREAFRVLESMGVVVARVGSGRNAGSFIASTATEALSRLLRIHVALTTFEMGKVIEARIVLEVAAAEMAAARATVAQIEGLNDLVRQMIDSRDDPAKFNDLDTSFHVAIAAASGNPLVAELMQAIREAIRRQMVRAFETRLDARAAIDDLITEHERLLRSIEARDAETAGRLVRQHIESFYDGTVVDGGALRTG